MSMQALILFSPTKKKGKSGEKANALDVGKSCFSAERRTQKHKYTSPCKLSKTQTRAQGPRQFAFF